MGKPYSKSDFLNRLAAGNKTEAFLADKLVEAGIVVVKPEYPEGMPTSYYTKNQVDLLANDRVLEVKGRNQNFTCVADFQYPTLFVEGTTGFDAKVHVPEFYVNVSNRTGAIIALDVAETKDSWTVEQVTDRLRNYSYPMYVSRTEQWIDWDEFIRRLGAK